jgi:release factor glutamine methyltransferase
MTNTSKTIDFLGVQIETGPGALIPRAETELLGRTAMAKLGGGKTIVDVCCGTGNLACAIATLIADVRGWALDLTDGAVALARTNVARLSLGDRITVAQGDLFAPLDGALRGTVDVVICNPPYISTAKLATRADLAEEPREAFDGGPYGVTIHQRVAREALDLLRPGGWLVMEHGVGQDRQVKIAVERARGYDAIEMIADDEGAPRVIAARRSSPPHE